MCVSPPLTVAIKRPASHLKDEDEDEDDNDNDNDNDPPPLLKPPGEPPVNS